MAGKWRTSLVVVVVIFSQIFEHLRISRISKKKVLSQAGFKERDQGVVSKVCSKGLSQLCACILGRKKKRRKRGWKKIECQLEINHYIPGLKAQLTSASLSSSELLTCESQKTMGLSDRRNRSFMSGSLIKLFATTLTSLSAVEKGNMHNWNIKKERKERSLEKKEKEKERKRESKKEKVKKRK